MRHVKQRHPLQILDARQRQRRAGDHDKAILMQQGAVQIAFRRFTVADGDVHGALAEIDPLDAGVQAQIDGGKLRLEIRQARHQPVGEKIGGGGDGQRRRLPGAGDLGDGLFQRGKGALGAGIQDLAGLGQADALRAALAHPAFQHRFQQLDLVADRRRAHAQRLGGQFEAAAAGHGVESAQRAQRRQTGFSYG